MTRNCLICGDMICGCAECRNNHNGLANIYGVCRSCTHDVAYRMGEQHSLNADELKVALEAEPDQVDKVEAKLEEWSRA